MYFVRRVAGLYSGMKASPLSLTNGGSSTSENMSLFRGCTPVTLNPAHTLLIVMLFIHA